MITVDAQQVDSELHRPGGEFDSALFVVVQAPFAGNKMQAALVEDVVFATVGLRVMLVCRHSW